MKKWILTLCLLSVVAVAIAFLLRETRGNDRVVGQNHSATAGQMTAQPVASPAGLGAKTDDRPPEVAQIKKLVTVISIDDTTNSLNKLPHENLWPSHITKARRDGALAKITFLVVDDEGRPVPDANVGGGFYNHERKGHGFSSRTDADGTVVLEDLCVYEMNFHIDKTGYYETRDRYIFFKYGFDCVKDGRWFPWNPLVKVILKRKVNPVAMYAFDYTANHTVIPKVGEPLGFDLMRGDWVVPYGTGKTPDFNVTYFRDGESRNFTHQELVFSANGPFAGFMRIKSDTYSVFKSPYHADTNDVYTQELRFTFDRPGGIGRYVDGKMNAGECIVFRSRTRVDKYGRLIGAYYGKIYGPLSFGTSNRGPGSMKLLHYLNPTENDTNLEYDPRKNLLYPKAGNTPP